VNYDVARAQAGTEKINFNNSWVGNINVDQITIGKVLPGLAKVDGGLVRITHTNVSGFGKVATFQFVLKDTASSGQMIFFATNVEMIDSAGSITALNGGADSAAIIGNTTNVKSNFEHIVSVYPNPVNSNLNISSKYEIETISLINSIGETIIYLKNCGKQEQIDVRKLQQGIYFIKVKSLNENVIQKIVVEH
jgi:hypothetical protein